MKPFHILNRGQRGRTPASPVFDFCTRTPQPERAGAHERELSSLWLSESDTWASGEAQRSELANVRPPADLAWLTKVFQTPPKGWHLQRREFPPALEEREAGGYHPPQKMSNPLGGVFNTSITPDVACDNGTPRGFQSRRLVPRLLADTPPRRRPPPTYGGMMVRWHQWVLLIISTTSSSTSMLSNIVL